jgi:hypothetical protein
MSANLKYDVDKSHTKRTEEEKQERIREQVRQAQLRSKERLRLLRENKEIPPELQLRRVKQLPQKWTEEEREAYWKRYHQERYEKNKEYLKANRKPRIGKREKKLREQIEEQIKKELEEKLREQIENELREKINHSN